MPEGSYKAQSPYAVALELAHEIAVTEGKPFGMPPSAPSAGADREYILQLYKECLEAVAAMGKL